MWMWAQVSCLPEVLVTPGAGVTDQSKMPEVAPETEQGLEEEQVRLTTEPSLKLIFRLLDF